MQIASYEDRADADPPEPSLSVILLRVPGRPATAMPAAELAESLRDRLTPAFAHLAEGQFLEAQAAAAAGGFSRSSRRLNGEIAGRPSGPRPAWSSAAIIGSSAGSPAAA